MDEQGAEDHALYIDEWSWSTFPPISEKEAASWYLAAIPAMIAEDRIGPIVLYNFRDKGPDATWENRLGLVARDFTAKQTYYAYRDVIDQAAGR